MATHSSVLAWRVPGMGSHRVGHDWSDLAITLQYFSGFCHTLTWITHRFTCAPHPDPCSHLHPHPVPLGLPSAPALSTCLMHPTWTGDLFSHLIIHVSMLFSQIIPPSPSPTESKSLFYTSVSLFLSFWQGNARKSIHVELWMKQDSPW